ncbi:MAG: glycosyltransferase [bacterium]|nr:glycosyltransferase [bacterium]
MLYRMRLLFITQAVDERDPVLGFVCNWLRVFAKDFEHISAVCLRKGEYDLPQNVSVRSLTLDVDGLQTSSVVLKIKRTMRFLRYVWRTRNEYDAVFVHMNQEYILLAGLLWRLLGKPVALWYNHTAGSVWTKIAMRIATVVFHTSPYAFTAGSAKSIRMPAGIDTKRFASVPEVIRTPHSILYLGRIAPIKGVKELVEATLALRARGENFTLTICGDALPRDAVYEREVRALAEPLAREGICRFLRAIPNTEAPRLLSAHEIFVNLTPRGNYDKTVLEAAACGALPVVSSPAFRDALPTELFFEERNPQSLADALERVFALSEERREEIKTQLRNYVVETHDLSLLVKKVKNIFSCSETHFQNVWLSAAREANRATRGLLQNVFREKKSKRIYYIANARIPTEKAHGIQIAKMSEALRTAGADLTLVVPRRGKQASLKDFYNLAADIPVARLSVVPYTFGFLAGSLSFMVSAFFFLLMKRLRGERFLVYTIDMDQFSFSLIPFLGVPYFVEIHDAKRRGFLFQRLFSRVQGVLTINNIIKNKLCARFNMSAERVLVAPNGISEEFFEAKDIPQKEARASLGLRQDKQIALYAGQFYAWKGLEIFAEATRLAPDVLFYLAGGTRESFERLTSIRDIPENLLFGGIRPYKEMPLLMRASDALIVLGTRRDEYSYFHTSPMKLFEYLPTGRPIVAARTPAVADMVSEREVFFYEPDSAESMARTIVDALNNTNIATEKSTASRSLAEKYTWKSRAEKVLAYLG